MSDDFSIWRCHGGRVDPLNTIYIATRWNADWQQQTNIIVESGQDGKRVWVQVGFLEGDEFILGFFSAL